MTDSEAHIAPDFNKNNIDPKIVSRLPRIPKAAKFQNAKLIGSGLHSKVYSVSVTYRKKTIAAVLKVFSEERWKENFEPEVHAYEFLAHFSVSGVIPIAYGYGDDWTNERFRREVLGDTILHRTSALESPVFVILLEYVAESAQLSPDNIDWKICKETLRGLCLIHSAQVLHRDIAERNILVVPSLGRVVWIDFSISWVNPSEMEAWDESKLAESILYHRLVYCFPW